MSIISEKISYLRGLAEGMGIDEKKGEGKLISEIISVLGEISDTIDYLEDSQDELFDEVYDLEDEVYGDCDCDCDCEDDEISITCPACDEEFVISVDELAEADEIVCPECGEVIEFEIDCDCDCDCDCDGDC